MSNDKRNTKWGYALVAGLLLAIGLSFIIFNKSLQVIGIASGIALVVFGAVFAVLAISAKKRDFAFAVKVTVASVAVVSGVTTAIFNDKAVEIFAAVFALVLIIDASFKLSTAAMCKRYSVELWWLMLIPTLITVILSFVTIKYPPQSPTAVSVLLGIAFVFEAASNVMAIPFGIKLERRQTADIYYNVYKRDLENQDKRK